MENVSSGDDRKSGIIYESGYDESESDICLTSIVDEHIFYSYPKDLVKNIYFEYIK